MTTMLSHPSSASPRQFVPNSRLSDPRIDLRNMIVRDERPGPVKLVV